MKRVGAGIRAAKVGEVLRVEILGEIDHHSTASVREQIDEGMYTERPKEVRLDLSGMRFMDSSGLGLIVGRLVTAKEIGCTVTITGADARTLRIFEMAGLERMRGLTIEKRCEGITNTMKGKKSS
ncbi:MAG: STAS domain-containing protein [Clostridia bacterium]|nr:STAS domain-containing protein [Clostridia bacterium]